MKSITKKITLAGLGAACALSLTLGAGILAKSSSGIAVAEESDNTNKGATFFYDNLLDASGKEYTLAKKFYEVLEKINKDGDLLDGVVDYPVSDVVTSDQLKAWIENGNLEVPRAFSAARDAFITDHPELFYINFYKMTISVAKSGGAYVGFINSGREANLYYENGFNTPETVTTAISAFNAKVNEVVDYVNGLQAADRYTARDAFLARAVNNYLANTIEYDYVAYDHMDDPDYVAATYINTAYGGLVENKCVCGGYSTSYKVIMDKLGIPCITVNGYSKNKDEKGNNANSGVYHMWNYVWLETPEAEAAQTFASKSAKAANGSKGEWYSVDVTWNHSSKNKSRYALLTSYGDDQIHVNDGVISSSGYRLRYPELSQFNYGSTGETTGLQSSRIYVTDSDGGLDDYGNPLVSNYSTVSYNGKSAKRLLEEDGLYIVCRYAYYMDGQTAWTKWMALENFRQFAEFGIDKPEELIQDSGTETRFYDNTSVYFTQFAVFDAAPDIPHHVHSEQLGIDKDFYFEYSDNLVDQSKALEVGEMFINKSYGTYTPPPYILAGNQETQIISDSMRDPNITDKVVVAENKALVFEIVYDEPLRILDKTKPIGITYISEHPGTKNYAKFFPINKDGNGNDVYVELVEGYENSGSTTKILNTLRFKFGPSLMYEHNDEGYHFIFSNVGSAKKVTRIVDGKPVEEFSNKAPNPAYYNFSRVVVACPACFNYDGRLYVDCCAQPTLISNSDLSEMNFLDENNESTFSKDRSQMMLIAERADDQTVDTMLDEISSNISSDLGIEKSKTETYDLSLQMCNKYPKIPDGSYVKIALGFPEGYGPNDVGVTFKLFHRKHISGDNYIIEEIPCVVTQFGIVATVTSFSPYMVAVVDADKATNKTVYASIEGKGGKLTKDDGQIRTLKEEDDPLTEWDDTTYTYTIQPDAGYQIYSVKLNGKEVKDNIVAGKLTLNYADVEMNNELVIQYIADDAATRIQQKLTDNVIDEQIEVEKFVVAVEDQPVYSNDPLPKTDDEANVPGDIGDNTGNNGQSGNNTNITAIVITVVCSVIALAALIAAVVVISKSKIKKN